MALNGDQLQLIEWYMSGYGSVALRHGLSEQLMAEWLQDQGYYQTVQGSELAERMLAELKAEIIGYQISCLDPLSAAVWLLLLTDHDKGQGNVAEQINSIVFDIVYGIKNLAQSTGTGLYRVDMTVVDNTELDQADLINYLDQRVTELSEHERELLELLSSPQSQPRSYYYGLIDTFRALD